MRVFPLAILFLCPQLGGLVSDGAAWTMPSLVSEPFRGPAAAMHRLAADEVEETVHAMQFAVVEDPEQYRILRGAEDDSRRYPMLVLPNGGR